MIFQKKVRKIKRAENFKESKWVFEVGGENMKEENALLKSSSENVYK